MYRLRELDVESYTDRVGPMLMSEIAQRIRNLTRLCEARKAAEWAVAASNHVHRIGTNPQLYFASLFAFR